MSAAEVIAQIRSLPPAEFEIVRNFLLNGAVGPEQAEDVKHLDHEKARLLGGRIMEENEELFRKLAQ